MMNRSASRRKSTRSKRKKTYDFRDLPKELCPHGIRVWPVLITLVRTEEVLRLLDDTWELPAEDSSE